MDYQDCILITDMDGTLLKDERGISKKNQAAIDFFIGQGGKFAVATGRTAKSAATFLKLTQVNAPCIFYNGAVLYDWNEHKVLQTKKVNSQELIHFIQDCMKEYPTICIQIYTMEKIYIITGEKSWDFQIIGPRHHFVYCDLAEIMQEEWIKVMFAAKREVLEDCCKHLATYQLDKTTNHFFSADYYFEFVGKAVSKGTMASDMLRLQDFQGKTVFAAGDFHNDIEMLEMADVGIAPANAEPEVKAVANIVSVSNRDDLMDAIVHRVMPDYFGAIRKKA